MKSTASLWLSLLLGLLLQFPLDAQLPAMAKMKHRVSAPVAVPVAVPVAAPTTAPVAMMTTVAPPADSNVQALEDTLYATHYDGEPVENRLNRLETTVFGQPAQGNLPPSARIARLKSVLSQPTDMTPLSPGNNTKANNQASAATSIAAPKQSPATVAPQDDIVQAPEPGETDYPIVTEMEKRVFSKSFETEEISRRLARLEKETFKTPQNGALADRVDHLRTVVLGDDNNNVLDPDRMSSNAPYSPPPTQWTPPGNYGRNSTGGGGAFTYYNSSNSTNTSDGSQTSSSTYGMQTPGNYGSGYSGNGYSGGNNRGDDRTATPDMLSAMNEIEKQVIGHTFPSEPMNVRLDRLESKVFNATSPEMSNEERMQRVIAVASAGGAPQSAHARTRSALQTLLPIILTILPMVLL